MATESESLMEVLTKEEKEVLLEKKMEEIRKKNKELEQRYKEIEADKKHAEEQKAAISAGASEHSRHGRDASFPVREDESRFSDETCGRDDSWAHTNYRQDWPEREEGDEPQYWQQSRQRGGKDSTFGQWTRGGGGPLGASSWQPQANERPSDGRGRRGSSTHVRGGRRPFPPGDRFVHADEDSNVSADSASFTSNGVVSPTTAPDPAFDKPDAQNTSIKTAAKADSMSGSTTGIVATAAGRNADTPAGHGSGRGRGRGIVPTPDQAKQGQLQAERSAAPGGMQTARQQNQQQQPPSRPPRQSPLRDEPSPRPGSKTTQHQQDQPKRSETDQAFESRGRSEGEVGHQQSGQQPSRQQPSALGGHQEQRSPHHQQSYEETRKRNAAAYEESIRSNPGLSSGRFLADRHRDVQTDYSKTNEEDRQFRQQQTSDDSPVTTPIRHQRNFGGAAADLEQVKSKVKEVAHVKQEAYRGRLSAQQDLELRMTGHERQQYAAWRQDRERIDQERMDRSRRAGDGSWRRQWDSDKGCPPSSRDSAAAVHEGRTATAPPRDATTRRVGSGRALGGGRAGGSRSPDHGGDRAAQAEEQQRFPHSKVLDETAAVMDSGSENITRSGGQGRQRRNRKRRDRAHAEKHPSKSESATNTAVNDGAGDAGVVINKSDRLSHVSDGDTSQHIQKGTMCQPLPNESLATRGDPYALPLQDTARISDDNVKTHATANDTRGAIKQDRQSEQQVSKDQAGSTTAADDDDENDDGWEDVDDNDGECSPEEVGDSGRHVVDWAAEVEKEYGSS